MKKWRTRVMEKFGDLQQFIHTDITCHCQLVPTKLSDNFQEKRSTAEERMQRNVHEEGKVLLLSETRAS